MRRGGADRLGGAAPRSLALAPPAGAHAVAPQLLQPVDVLLLGRVAAVPGPSKIAGRPSKRGSERKAAQPRAPSSPSPGGAWRSRFEPSGVFESFTCRQRTRLGAHHLLAVVDHRGRACPRCGCRSRDASMWQESRHSAQPLVAAGQLDQLGQLLEGAAERVAGARGVLEQQVAARRTRRAPRAAPRRPAAAPPRAARPWSSRGGAPRRRRRSRRPAGARGRARRATCGAGRCPSRRS